jgi:hypothetical protein
MNQNGREAGSVGRIFVFVVGAQGDTENFSDLLPVPI